MTESDYLPKEVLEGLQAARRAERGRKSRLRVEADGAYYPILRKWDGGFALDAASTPRLRGLVDIHDGARHLYQCLIIASDEEDGERLFEFKRATAAQDRAPLDFVRDEEAPIALLGPAS